MLNAVQICSRRDGFSAADISRTFQIPLKTVQSWEKGEKRPPAWVESQITHYLEQLKNDRRKAPARAGFAQGGFAQGRSFAQGGGFGQGGFAQGGRLQGGFMRPPNFPK